MSQSQSKVGKGGGDGPEWVTVVGGNVGQRIDNFLMGQLKGVPRSRIYRMLRRGEVRINGSRCRPGDRLEAGDRVRIPPVAMRQGGGGAPQKAQEQVLGAFLFEDEAMAVLNKPAGMAVHSGSGISYGVIEALRAARSDVAWGLAHRLDRGTSGCLVVGKGKGPTRALQAAFREDRVTKAYLGLLVGAWAQGERLVDVPLRRGPEREGQRAVVPDPRGGQEASSRFLTLRIFRGYTLVRAEPKTGRTHQIRVHAQYLGHPLAGDPLYGDPEANADLKKLGLDRMFLHSAEVGVPHPNGGGKVEVSASLPRELKTLLDQL
ncbi:RluA family pseudouridine synthase [Thiohalorhabdus sp.]|uniref:RluA family pseudouridine synthase n=1 Tax=Thiohalorhabdus sp. TaxID=3094134 RepID=UPI002FC36817